MIIVVLQIRLEGLIPSPRALFKEGAMVLFGQIVIGPPGCGKTTYCMGMQMFAEAVGRSCKVVNMDFANDSLPYTAAIDVRELVSLEVTEEKYGRIELANKLYFQLIFLERYLSSLEIGISQLVLLYSQQL